MPLKAQLEEISKSPFSGPPNDCFMGLVGTDLISICSSIADVILCEARRLEDLLWSDPINAARIESDRVNGHCPGKSTGCAATELVAYRQDSVRKIGPPPTWALSTEVLAGGSGSTVCWFRVEDPWTRAGAPDLGDLESLREVVGVPTAVAVGVPIITNIMVPHSRYIARVSYIRLKYTSKGGVSTWAYV